MWSGEEEFKPLLQKALLKPSKGSLAAVTDIAVRDEKWCYKSVCFDLEKASKRVHKKQRLNVLYVVSDICRNSKTRLASKDKYGARFQNILPRIFQRLDAAPLHHVAQAEKVLLTWRREGLFAPDILSKYERLLAEAKAKAEAAPQTQSSAVKGAPSEDRHVQAQEHSPDTYDPFLAILEDDSDLPGPLPLVPRKDEIDRAAQVEPQPKKLRLSPKTAAKETGEQSGSIARAQAIADRLALLSDPANDILPGPPAIGSGASSQIHAEILPAEHASLPASASALPGVSAADQQSQQPPLSIPSLAVADTRKRRRPSRFDQPAAEAQLPPPPQLAQPLPGPPPLPVLQQQSETERDDSESMREKALALAARFAADAGYSSAPASAALVHNSESAHTVKQQGTAGASTESEFENDSDPFKGLPPVPPAPAPAPPQAARSLPAQPHSASHMAPPPATIKSEHDSSQPSLAPPPQRHLSWASQQAPLAAQQRVPQPPRGFPPEQPQLPVLRPPPPGPRPPPGAPPACPPPPYFPHYPSHLHARPPPRPPPGAPAWHAATPTQVLPYLGGGAQQSWGTYQGVWGAPPAHAVPAVAGQSEEGRLAEDSTPPPPPPLPSQADAAAVH